MLWKIRMVMAQYRDSIYRLENLINAMMSLLEEKKTGKRGRGAAGKKPVLFAIERRENHTGFMAALAVEVITNPGNREGKPG
jgi:hypothetical protein